MKFRFLIFALCLIPFAASAADLSATDAISRVVSESNDLKRAEANAARASAALDYANANRWFNLDATATYMNVVNVERPGRPIEFALPGGATGLPLPPMAFQIPDNIGMAGVTLTQPIYTFGKIGNAVESARSAIKSADAGHEMARREVEFAAAQMYWTAKMTEGLVKIAEENLASAVKAKKQIESAGRANRASLVKIQADIAARTAALNDAKFNRDSAHNILKIMAGMNDDEELNLTDEFPSAFGSLDAAEMTNNPEWDLYRTKAEMSERQARSKRAGNYPTLAATASYNYIATHTEYQLWQGNKSQSAYWGLSLSMPIFDGGLNRANATLDAMDAAAANADLAKSKQMRTHEFETAVRQYDHLTQNLKSYEEARDLANKSAQMSADRFAAGQTSANEMSDAQNGAMQMNAAVLNAKYNIIMARETVKKLADKK